MISEQSLPRFDIPVDFMVGDDISSRILMFYSNFPCKIKSCIVILCSGGEIRASVNMMDYTFRKGDLIVVLPDSFIQIYSLTDDVGLYYAGFSSAFMENVNLLGSVFDELPRIRENAVISLNDDIYSFYEDYYRLLIKAVSNPVLSSDSEARKSILNIFIRQFCELSKKIEPAEENLPRREKEIYMEFLHILRMHYVEQHSASFYAREIGVTLQHFCRTIKHASGKTPSEIIIDILIMDAKAHLKSTSMSVKEISYALGFKNSAFFHKFFKRHVGITPLAYRGN